METAIGIDIGGTNTKIGVVDRNGKCLLQKSFSTTDFAVVEDYVKHLAATISNMLEEAVSLKTDLKIAGIGIGAPNGNYYNGTIEYAPNLAFKGIVPLGKMIEKACEAGPVVLTNDANAAALGEMMYGAARGMKNFIMITLGTGLGSGVVSDGNMVYGHDGFAGEIGHTNVFPEGRLCGCGRHGCLEAYVSAPGLKRTVFELLSYYHRDSILQQYSFNSLSAVDIDKAARQGDFIAKEAFDYTGEILGRKLADAVAHTSPEAFILFGGLANAGELIFNPTKLHFEENLLEVYKNKINILPSQLSGSDAAIIGASSLVWKEIAPRK